MIDTSSCHDRALKSILQVLHHRHDPSALRVFAYALSFFTTPSRRNKFASHQSHQTLHPYILTLTISTSSSPRALQQSTSPPADSRAHTPPTARLAANRRRVMMHQHHGFQSQARNCIAVAIIEPSLAHRREQLKSPRKRQHLHCHHRRASGPSGHILTRKEPICSVLKQLEGLRAAV
eukprot:612771-Rhodomonas_salina.2